jgi:hypothetical protein
VHLLDVSGEPQSVGEIQAKGKISRALALAAHLVDNQSTSGPAFKAVFPDGLDREIRPRGAAQLKAARRVDDRLATQPAAAALKADHGAAIKAACADFEVKIKSRKAAGETLGLARAQEDGARETWVAAYDSNAGAIRAMFPRQRARQDLYFDQFRSRSANADEDEDDGDSPESPAAPGSGTEPTT